MRKKWLILGFSLLVIINLSALATLGYHRWCRYRAECQYRRNRLEENTFYQQIAISEDQIKKMKVCRQSFLSRTDRISSGLREKRIELVDLLIAAEPDIERIHILLTHIDSLQAELQKGVISYLLEGKRLLTPEQQKEFFTIIKNRILLDTGHHLGNGLDPMETSCDVKCQEAN
jgi:Spy/CpxP family protein refolding chaperone